MTKRRHAAGNGVSQTVRMIDITYAAAAAATAVANLSSLSYRNFIVLTFLWILIRLLWQWAYYRGRGVAVNLLRQASQQQLE